MNGRDALLLVTQSRSVTVTQREEKREESVLQHVPHVVCECCRLVVVRVHHAHHRCRLVTLTLTFIVVIVSRVVVMVSPSEAAKCCKHVWDTQREQSLVDGLERSEIR